MEKDISRRPFSDVPAPEVSRSFELLRWRGSCGEPSSSLAVIDRAPKWADVCLLYVADVSTGTSTCNDSAYLATAMYEEALEALYDPKQIRFFGFDVDPKYNVSHFYEFELRWAQNGFKHCPDSLPNAIGPVPCVIGEASLANWHEKRERTLETAMVFDPRRALRASLRRFARKLGLAS